ncbi:MAG: SDR family NAD(P)-dependent oxidoreductase, partial [bacterium]|nr:SDR family NAD(P)-dependent oxidoreductase [bacterium]
MEYLKELFNISGKVVVITGGAGILAGEMANGFLKAGTKVILIDINKTNLDKRVKNLTQVSND